jgi:hypothetical protein
LRTPKLAAVSAAVLIAMAGCGQATDSNSGGSAAAVATTAPADPVEQVNAASRKLEDSSFKFSIESAGVKAEGVRHKPSESTQLKMTGSNEGQEFTIELIQIADDSWMKMDLGLDPGDDEALQGLADAFGKWNKIPKEKAESDVGALAKAGAEAMGTQLVKGASNLKETAPGTFTGTIDLTSKLDLEVADEETVKALGDKAKAVPITITIDDQKRLSSMVMDIPAAGAAKAQRATIKFFDFDNVQQPQAPPADQINGE